MSVSTFSIKTSFVCMARLYVQRQGSTVNSAIEADRNISNKDKLYICEVHNTAVLNLVIEYAYGNHTYIFVIHTVCTRYSFVRSRTQHKV